MSTRLYACTLELVKAVSCVLRVGTPGNETWDDPYNILIDIATEVVNMRTVVLTALLMAVLLAPAFAQPTLQVGTRGPDFALKDQFDKSWSLSGLSGTVTVLIVADSDSGRAMGPWVDALKARYSNKVQTLGMLDLHTVPGIGRGIARSRIRRETKDPLMLDFSGSIGRTYGVSSKVPTIVVIDKTGVVRAVVRGAFDQASFNGIAAAVDKALK